MLRDMRRRSLFATVLALLAPPAAPVPVTTVAFPRRNVEHGFFGRGEGYIEGVSDWPNLQTINVGPGPLAVCCRTPVAEFTHRNREPRRHKL